MKDEKRSTNSCSKSYKHCFIFFISKNFMKKFYGELLNYTPTLEELLEYAYKKSNRISI